MATATQLAFFLFLAQIATVNDSAEKRLAYMQQTGASYQVSIGVGASKETVAFRKEPVLRFTNPVSGVVDGGLFVWEDQSKRPIAANE